MRGSAGSASDVVALDQTYELLPGERLPEFDSPQAEAFGARERRAGNPFVCLVGRADLAPRRDLMAQLARQDRLAMMSAVSWGTVDWPPADGERFVGVFRRPRGRRVQDVTGAAFRPWREDDILRKAIEPLAPVLRDLDARALTHRAIRADNLFFEDPAETACILGECVMAPAGMDQPALYEPIEGMLAMPGGRGVGYGSDDLYAFGVLIAVLLAGGDPTEGMDPAALVQSKIHRGSYATLIGRTRLSLPMMEVLRGLLCDQRAERWTLNDLMLWLGGRRLSPKQPSLPTRGQRAYPIGETNAWSTRAIAAQFCGDWQAGVDALQRNDLPTWARRSLGDEALAERIASAASVGAGTAGGGGGLRDRLVSRLITALDPKTPLVYRGFAASIDSLGQALAVHWENSAHRQAFGEIVRAKLPQAWLDSQPLSRSEHAILRKSFEAMHHFVSRTEAGYGLERCLYEFNDHWPCLSPLLEGQYVSEASELLPALERLAQAGATDGEPVDRHIAAFACARLKVVPDRILRAMATEDNEPIRRLAVAYFVGEVQRATGQSGFHGLAAWVAGLLAPVVGSFHNREQRKQLAERLDKAAAGGDLVALAQAADDADARLRDEDGFERARAEFAALDREIAELEAGALLDPAHVRQRSRQAASLLAGCIASTGLLLLTVLYVT
jgi:hypothetical protein